MFFKMREYFHFGCVAADFGGRRGVHVFAEGCRRLPLKRTTCWRPKSQAHRRLGRSPSGHNEPRVFVAVCAQSAACFDRFTTIFFFSFLNVPTVLLVDSSMRDTLDRSLVARPLPESPTLVYTCINGQCPRAPTVIRVINSLSSVGKSSTEKESLKVEADVERSCDRANY